MIRLMRIFWEPFTQVFMTSAVIGYGLNCIQRLEGGGWGERTPDLESKSTEPQQKYTELIIPNCTK